MKELDQLLRDPKVANAENLMHKAGRQAGTRIQKFQNSKGYNKLTDTEKTQGATVILIEEMLKINLFSRKPKKIKMKIGSRENIKETRMSSSHYGQKMTIDEAKVYMHLLNKLLNFCYERARDVVDAHESLEQDSHKALVLGRAFLNRLQTVSSYALADYNAIMKTTMGSASKIVSKYDAAVSKREDIKNELKDATKNM